MRIVLVNYDHHPEIETPAELLAAYRTLPGMSDGLIAAGAAVTVVQGFDRDLVHRESGADYELVAGPFTPHLPRWRIPQRLHRRVLDLAPDVVHVNGLVFSVQARALAATLPRRCPLLLQHHGESPRRGLRGLVERRGLRCVDGFLFTCRELAAPWLAKRRISSRQPIYEVIEGSSRFAPQPPAAARKLTGMEGDPVCLWAGHLDTNKDPLTLLDGFAHFLESRPQTRLYMAFAGQKLLAQVRARLAASPPLAEAVTLLGRVAYERMEAHFNSADLYLSTSHREGSGYALLDALACGVVPVVSDIPSFRALTGGGEIGRLWPPGEPLALAAALEQALQPRPATLRAQVRAHFEDHLSFEAIGRQALAAYRRAVARNRRSERDRTH